MPPRTPPGLGRLRRANFSPGWTFKISLYPTDYRYLVAYEIIAQGWKKRLCLEENDLLQEYLDRCDKTFVSYTVTLKPQKTPAHLLHVKVWKVRKVRKTDAKQHELNMIQLSDSFRQNFNNDLNSHCRPLHLS